MNSPWPSSLRPRLTPSSCYVTWHSCSTCETFLRSRANFLFNESNLRGSKAEPRVWLITASLPGQEWTAEQWCEPRIIVINVICAANQLLNLLHRSCTSKRFYIWTPPSQAQSFDIQRHFIEASHLNTSHLFKSNFFQPPPTGIYECTDSERMD